MKSVVALAFVQLSLAFTGGPGAVVRMPRARCASVAAAPRMAFSLVKRDEGPSEEVQGLYRMLGLAEDADYDEINRAYDALSVKYKGETKRLIKLQVTKDKILEDRLRQRISGSLKGAADSPYDQPDAKHSLGTAIRGALPPFLDRVVEFPTQLQLVKNAAVFGMFGLLPAVSRTWATTSISLGFATALYLLYNRGVVSNNEMSAEMRPVKARPLVLAAGITFLAGAVGAILSQLLFGLLSGASQELVIALCTCFAWLFSASFCKVRGE